MTIEYEERIRRADQAAQPAHYFSYVLQFEDGAFYVGSTNAPFARWTEHAVGVGAKATSGRRFTVRMALPFLSRREAEYNEKRLQKALARGPRDMEAMLAVFDQILDVVRPPKTFSQLRKEEEAHESEMRSVFHHSKALMWNLSGLPPTTCGYTGWQYYSTQSWDALIQQAREEDALRAVGGNYAGRKVCRRCLEHAP